MEVRLFHVVRYALFRDFAGIRVGPVARCPGPLHDPRMLRVRKLASDCFRLCGIAAVVLFASTGHAAPEPTTGPAYGVEQGEAPKNSIPVGASPAPAQPTPPATTAPPAGAPAPAPDATPAPAAGEAGTTTSTEVSDNDPRALTDFKPQLDPYGTWVEDPKYGLVWVPDRSIVGAGFSPYVTAGHWALDTGNNWVWISDYPFGDVVFHYGRWAYTSSYGWSWIPGYRYAPAWVSWRVPTGSYAYVGWAPMPPTFLWWGGVGMSIWWGAPYYWVFCPSHYVFARYPSYYVVNNRTVVHTLAGSTQRYTAAPHAPRSPTLQAARVPASTVPANRIPAATANRLANGASWAPGRTAPRTMGPSRTSRPMMQAPPSFSRDVPYASPRSQPSRTFSASPRAPRPDSYQPLPRAAPPPRAYAPAAGSSMRSPQSFSVPGRSFVAPRAYSPAPHFVAPSRVYSPAPRVYSTPGPSYHAPAAHPSFSAPRMSAPQFHGGPRR